MTLPPCLYIVEPGFCSVKAMINRRIKARFPARSVPGMMSLIKLPALLAVLAFAPCSPPVFAAAVADDLQAIFSAQAGIKSMESAFVQTKTLSLFDETVEASGTITIEKPDFYCWTYTSPEHSIFYVDGQRTGSYQPDSGARDEIDLENKAGLATIIQSITAIITGNLETTATSDFEVTQDTSGDGMPAYTFRPQTEELQSLFEQVIIRFDEHSKLARELEIVEQNGDSTHMAFKDWRINIPVDRSGLLR